MKNVLLALSLLSIIGSSAQDTTWVQTFTYDSISTRRAMFDFPTELDGKRFEKVLMYYNIKCDPLTPWDSYNCGEWDYLAYSHIYDHLGIYDSTRVEHPLYLLNNADEPTIEYVTSLYYHYTEYYQYFPVYTVDTDTDVSVGAGSTAASYPFGASSNQQRTQLLYTATELTTSGISAGEIAKLRFDFTSLGDQLDHLKISLKHTTETEVSEFDEDGWTEVYNLNATPGATGLNTFNFHTPFVYDGTSGILVDLTWDNAGFTSTDNEVNSTVTTDQTVVYSNDDNGILNVDGNYGVIDLDNHDFGDEISIGFWAYGDPVYLPVNTSVLEGTDSLGNRIINIHFPWSNERQYWDSGEGGGYDRVDKAASTGEYEGNWHQWTFTKNAATGTMNIYLDGVLWHSGTGLSRPVGVVNQFKLGANRNGGNNWGGMLDEFTIWDVELSVSDISTYLNETIDAGHPEFSNLVAYYDFDDSPVISDKSGNNVNGMMTEPGMIELNGQSKAGFETSNVRPNIVFVQGTHTFDLDSTLVSDSVEVDMVDLATYEVEGQKFLITSIEHHYPVGYSYTFDYLGNKTADSVYYGPDATLTNDVIHYYEEPYELVDRYEIGRFITPYGIGFDLGPNGFTYIYDVTDYESLLHGTVDLQTHNTQELIDVKFAFIEGIPPRDVISLDKLWDGRASYTYANLDNDLNLSAIDVDLDPSGAMYKIRSKITGHGHHGSNNCCEWGFGEGRDHFFLVNGTQVHEWEIWQETECGDNPNISQGGTWPYAREGWCPGDIVEDHEFDITPFVTSGSTVSLDYDIEDVPVSDPDQGNGNYMISMHLVTYGEPNFQNDAAIVDVLNPNDWEYYSKWNPTCQNPRVILKNTGEAPLTSAKISIWVGGFGDNVITYDWTGNLQFLEEEVVEIPITDGWWYDWEGVMTFSAEVYEANGATDDYAQNNIFTTTFEAAPNIQESFYIWLRTNNKADENELYVRNSDGDVIFSRTDLENDTEYKDTLELDPGCYTIELTDSDNDGLSFWYSASVEGETGGSMRLRRSSGGTIHVFDPDFGNYTSYSFSVGYAVGMEENINPYVFEVYPNPSNGIFNISLDGFTENVTLEIFNEMGQLVKTESIGVDNPEGVTEHTLSMEGFERGIYIIRAVSESVTQTQRIILN